jgi:alginate O-acetyltransferase complex protein AlgI
MLFCSREYLLFFVMIFTLYWVMPWARARVWLLLFASFYFYASWNKWLALLICVSTVADYFLALGIERWTQPRIRRGLLILSISANLCLLGYFKYANFFLQSLEEGLRAAGASASLPLLQVILPVGISFYTFEAINYVVDVYRRKAPAERNLGHFMLFITFFPHLVAGPIVRAKDFLPQIRRPKHWDWARVQLGVEYFLMGLFKKLAIADRMALFVDPVFENPSAYQSHTVWLAVLAYGLQIYCDFSGYTDMAIGSAHMLGYKLAPNFNMPYLSSNISEFWRRWHISLSTWLRDYIFMPLCFRGTKRSKRDPHPGWLSTLVSIPLGGERGSGWRIQHSFIVTMTLGGLWHGASWNFVIFGVVHGLLIVGHRMFREFAEKRPRLEDVLNTRLGNACCVALTFLSCCFTMVLFRGSSFEQIGTLFQRMLIPTAGLGTPMPAAGLLYTYILVGLCHWIAYQSWFKHGLRRVPAEAVGLGYCSILMAALLLAPKSGQAFIYFQF